MKFSMVFSLIQPRESYFVGRALGYLGDERFTQSRVGAHVTQIEFNKIEVDLSGKYTNDSVVRPGVFGKIEVSGNF